jgi:hypothetical protein
MPFFADRYGSVWTPSDCLYNCSVSTAIARIYTPEGFVIASDGRKSRSDTNAVLSDSEQKIFGIEQPNRRLAYALSGAIQLTHKDTDEILFDYLVEAEAAFQKLALERPKSLYHYTYRAAEEIAEAAERSVAPVRDELDASIEGSEAYIFIDGYYDTRPKRTTITFKNHVHGPLETTVITNELYPGRFIGYGSPEVLRLLNTDDIRFARYHIDAERPEDVTLALAIQMGVNVILAHNDPEAHKIDPKTCAAIGGTIRVAMVTLSQGFQWVDHASTSAMSQM